MNKTKNNPTRVLRLPLHESEVQKFNYLVEKNCLLKAQTGRLIFLQNWEKFKQENQFGVFIPYNDWLKLSSKDFVDVVDFFVAKEIYDEVLDMSKRTTLSRQTLLRLVCIPIINDTKIPKNR